MYAKVKGWLTEVQRLQLGATRTRPSALNS